MNWRTLANENLCSPPLNERITSSSNPLSSPPRLGGAPKTRYILMGGGRGGGRARTSGAPSGGQEKPPLISVLCCAAPTCLFLPIFLSQTDIIMAFLCPVRIRRNKKKKGKMKTSESVFSDVCADARWSATVLNVVQISANVFWKRMRLFYKLAYDHFIYQLIP